MAPGPTAGAGRCHRHLALRPEAVEHRFRPSNGSPPAPEPTLGPSEGPADGGGAHRLSTIGRWNRWREQGPVSDPVQQGDGPTLEMLASRETEVGGTPVRRALPQRGRRTVGAWCFADHLGPLAAGAGPMGIGPHPHIGLHTVTWLVAGSSSTGTVSARSRPSGRDRST